MPPFIVHVPNIITIGRLLCVPLALWLILEDRLTLAFWLFVIAGISDGVDGFIARSFRARTKLGGILDPLADKALLVGVFLALGYEHLVSPWLVGLIVLRDIVIVIGVGILTLLLKERLAMQPLWVSKANTALQLALAALVLAVQGPGLGLDFYVMPMTWLVALTTGWSLTAYVLRGLLILRTRGTADDSGTAGGNGEAAP